MASGSILKWGVVTKLSDGDNLFLNMLYHTRQDARNHVSGCMDLHQRVVRVRVTWSDIPRKKSKRLRDDDLCF
jgi:hypothetical protein